MLIIDFPVNEWWFWLVFPPAVYCLFQVIEWLVEWQLDRKYEKENDAANKRKVGDEEKLELGDEEKLELICLMWFQVTLDHPEGKKTLEIGEQQMGLSKAEAIATILAGGFYSFCRELLDGAKYHGIDYLLENPESSDDRYIYLFYYYALPFLEMRFGKKIRIEVMSLLGKPPFLLQRQ